jgi:photosystem II stability/assembly factor-like uncharacterized protein
MLRLAPLALVVCACQTATPAVAITDPHWDVQYRDSAALFIGISAVDSEVVWAAGSGGRVARTTDGGDTWTVRVVPGADSIQFRDVQAFSATDAVVLSIGNGPASRIYVTHDGGNNWTLAFRNEDPKAFFDCLAFWDRERGFAFSDSHDGEFTLIRTDDGGRSWRRIDPAAVPDAREGEGAFAASGTCTIARPGGLGWFGTGASGVDTRVIRTTDYGATWQGVVTPLASRSSGEGITSLTFLDDRHGVAFGSRLEGPDSTYANVVRTTDGGETWTPTGSQALRGVVYGGAYVPGTPTPTLVAVGPSGSAYSIDDGASWTRIDSTNTWTVTFVSPTAGWSAGRGHISRFRNGAR